MLRLAPLLLLLLLPFAALLAAPAATRPDGRAGYARHCASCHGAGGEGQADWSRPNAQGRLPAPPLDAAGHAWQHPDAELARIVATGRAPGAAPGYQTDMPGFAARLSPAEIAAILGFVKSRWPVGMQASQALLNPGGQGEFLRLLRENPDAEWTFPGVCIPPGAPEKP